MKKQEKLTPNYYLTLDIIPGATHNEILHAYNRAKMTYSAGSLASYSLLESESSNSILNDIEKAFDVLGNPARRREYDLKMGFETWSEEVSKATLSGKGPSIYGRATESSAESPPSVTTYNQKPRLEVLPSPSPASEKPILKSVPDPSPAFEPNPEFEKQIAEVQSLDGAFLRAVRIYRQFSAENLGIRCKLTAHHVMAIEDEEAGKLHHPTYLRGHVAMLCKLLGIPNGESLAKTFVLRLQAEGKVSRGSF